MKPSPKDRCARAIVRDFLVGLAVFLAVFTLAMLDSRASRSAPAVASLPATTQAETHTTNKISASTPSNIGPGDEITIHIDYQEMLRRNGEAYSLRFPLVVAPRHAHKPVLQPVKLDVRAGVSGLQTKLWTQQKIASLESHRYSGRLASEDLPYNHPAGLVSSAGEAKPIMHELIAAKDIPAPRGQSSKLALKNGTAGAGNRAVPGAPDASDRTWILTVMALIFAAMTTLTLGLWRHLSHSVAHRGNGRRV